MFCRMVGSTRLKQRTAIVLLGKSVPRPRSATLVGRFCIPNQIMYSPSLGDVIVHFRAYHVGVWLKTK